MCCDEVSNKTVAIDTYVECTLADVTLVRVFWDSWGNGDVVTFYNDGVAIRKRDRH
jgi:hypothetical protein